MYTNINYNHVYFELILVKQSTLNIVLFAKLNVCQFALHSNSSNLTFAKYTMYTVYQWHISCNMLNFSVSHNDKLVVIYIHIYIYVYIYIYTLAQY